MAGIPDPAGPPRQLFGTNGIRGIVNEEMTVELALRMGLAVGGFLRGEVWIATDARLSNGMLKSAMAAGLMAAGADVVDAGLASTPALQFVVRAVGAAGGVVISASHNPPEFNGIKVIAADGTEVSREDERRLEALYFGSDLRAVSWDRCGKLRSSGDIHGPYERSILSQLDVAAVRAAELCVVLDCGNGVGGLATPRILAELGVETIALNAQPDGTFPAHPSEPTPEHLGGLFDAVKESGAQLGIAHDGDADRAVFVDEHGEYVLGDRSMAVLAQALARAHGGGLVVTPVSTSSIVEEAIRPLGGSVLYTEVGSPVVARVMRERGAIFGGEENGGLIFPRHQYCRDGAMTAAKMVEVVATAGPLSRLVAALPERHLVKLKEPRPPGWRLDPQALGADRAVKVDRTDGAKFYFSDGSWVLVRPSGTEPIIRIFAEARTGAQAQALAEEFRSRLRSTLPSP